jgi:hypothetical protein
LADQIIHLPASFAIAWAQLLAHFVSNGISRFPLEGLVPVQGNKTAAYSYPVAPNSRRLSEYLVLSAQDLDAISRGEGMERAQRTPEASTEDRASATHLGEAAFDGSISESVGDAHS